MFKNIGKTNGKTAAPLSVIARDMRIVGDIITEGEMQVDGQVDGDIVCHTLVVGDGGLIKGEITSKLVRVHGQVIGKINGEAVAVAKTGRVQGDITHQTLEIAAGASIEGHLIRKTQPLALTDNGQGLAQASLPQPAE